MPVEITKKVLLDGFDTVPYSALAVKLLPVALVLYVLKYYFSGSVNGSERTMHGKVVIITVCCLCTNTRVLYGWV